MKALILAAGYGTRLRPLTDTTAKPLITLRGKPIIEYLLQRILPLSAIDTVYIVTNDKYFKDFVVWQESFDRKRGTKSPPILLLNDGTSSDKKRLGAIRDMAIAIETFSIRDDLMISAADDIFMFDFQNLVDTFEKKGKSVITLHPSNNIDVLRSSGNAQIDAANGRVLYLVEKPLNPQTNLVSPCLYILDRSALSLINCYLQAEKNPDAPGHFLSWLVEKTDVFSYIFEEPFYTIGNKAAYEHVQTLFC